MCLVVTLCVIGFGAPANANEDPLALQVRATPPRAAPIARAYPRSFSSYDALIEYATAVAAEQNTLDTSLAAARTKNATSNDALSAVSSPLSRGGLLREAGEIEDARGLATSLRAAIDALATAQRQLLAAGALGASQTSWHFPLVGELSQPFGPTTLRYEPRRVYEGKSYAHFHEGVDIAAPWGSPIFAPAPGRVVFAGSMADGAEVVVIAHQDGLVSLYAHLDRRTFPPSLRPGDTVLAGDLVGVVGLTGLTTGAHLHWAVYRDGALIDPLTLIPQ